MPVSTPATLALDQLSIPYRLFEHSHPPATIEQAAFERNQCPEQVIRSILFRFEKDKFFLVLMAGPGQISWRKLRLHLLVSRIAMATGDEVLAITGYAVGTVSPLGLLNPIRILADESVFKPEEISLGSGIRGAAVIMKPADLLLALRNIEVGQFC
jgi:Cys-tRNA(Pro)/Cys-tRNA(Cys) deacylase